eukprot:7069974-Alexandrium_andersonii.AAC.1
MPANFSEDLLDAYLRLPAESLPLWPPTGRANFTTSKAVNSKIRIEIHLADRRFYVKCDAHGKKVPNPGIKWNVAKGGSRGPGSSQRPRRLGGGG